MNPLKKLSDPELLSQTLEVARQERAYSLALIEHLLEVDVRKLYATLGHDSLFRYVVKELGYSESTAYERIRAMRLVRIVPQAREKLRTGELTLTAAARVESFRRQESLPDRAAVELVEEVSNKNLREVEILLLSKSESPLPRETIRQLTPELKEVRLILTPELQGLIERYEELKGKQSVSEILKTVLEQHLKVHDPLQKAGIPKVLKSEKSPQSDGLSTYLPNLPSLRSTEPIAASAKLRVTSMHPRGSRYIAAETRRKLWLRSQGRCEWLNPETGVRCASRFRLQFDHYPKPFARGGGSSFENLRHVCQAHNARFGIEEFGARSRG